MEKLLYTGKAKQMWQTDDPEVLRVVYMDQATALNGKKKEHLRLTSSKSCQLMKI